MRVGNDRGRLFPRGLPRRLRHPDPVVLLEPGQTLEGVIIAQDDDVRIRRALFIARDIRLMKYRFEFHPEA